MGQHTVNTVCMVLCSVAALTTPYPLSSSHQRFSRTPAPVVCCVLQVGLGAPGHHGWPAS